MFNIYLSTLMALFAFQAFTFTYQVSGVRKTVLNTPIALFENSIPIFNANNPNYKPYFDKKALESSLNYYFEDNLKDYVYDYEISYYYYSTKDNLFCKGDYCDGIKVNVKAKVLFAFSFNEKMFYEIKDTSK